MNHNRNILTVTSVLVMCLAVCNAATEDYSNYGLRAILRVYDECQRADGGFSLCIKKKAVTFIDRATKIDAVNIDDGMKIVRNGDGATDDTQKALTETELELSLPRGFEARDDALSNILMEKVSHFFNGRMIQISLPKMTPDEIGRGLEEGNRSYRYKFDNNLFYCLI